MDEGGREDGSLVVAQGRPGSSSLDRALGSGGSGGGGGRISGLECAWVTLGWAFVDPWRLIIGLDFGKVTHLHAKFDVDGDGGKIYHELYLRIDLQN